MVPYGPVHCTSSPVERRQGLSPIRQRRLDVLPPKGLELIAVPMRESIPQAREGFVPLLVAAVPGVDRCQVSAHRAMPQPLEVITDGPQPGVAAIDAAPQCRRRDQWRTTVRGHVDAGVWMDRASVTAMTYTTLKY